MAEMEIPRLFIGGIRMLLLLLAYVGVPLLVGWLLSLILGGLSFGMLGVVACFPLAVAGFVGPFLFFLREFMPTWRTASSRTAGKFGKSSALPGTTGPNSPFR